MYRRTRKYQKNITRQAEKRLKDELSSSSVNQPFTPPPLPELRRVIEITDYDSGDAVSHRIELLRCDRIDCYDMVVNGPLWRKRIGWSRVLEGLRKALPRQRQME